MAGEIDVWTIIWGEIKREEKKMAGKSKPRKLIAIPHYERGGRYGDYYKKGVIYVQRSQKPEGYIMFQKNKPGGETVMRMKIEDFQQMLDFAQGELDELVFDTLSEKI